ncbi:MAG: hypothetical protein EP335_12330 [Alphaproteobacteria bacterium]|nr:MAG: hypothetical protein EP335_12330 [Alphaproteobacteria bacterium]
MLMLLFYYLAGFGILSFLGFLFFKYWDRSESKQTAGVILETDWVQPVAPAAAGAPTAQELYDFSTSFLNMLKGVMAAPTPAKLKRLNDLLASPHILDAGLWKDMAMRLSDVASRYSTEYAAVVQAIEERSDDKTQRHGARKMALVLAASDARLATLAEKLAQGR